ncbi:MAG: PQQ-binding-like beta-propeller repeat protein [Halobacteriales archaeon]|nr:PQQ-binding-like beta-propeller repeat protein [Halobacteriales archaeon]
MPEAPEDEIRRQASSLSTPTRRHFVRFLASVGTASAVARRSYEPATAQENDGRLLWRFETGNSVNSSPTVADGTVYVGSNDNSMYALDAETGDELWRFETEGSVFSSPTVAEFPERTSEGCSNPGRTRWSCFGSLDGDSTLLTQERRVTNSWR